MLRPGLGAIALLMTGCAVGAHVEEPTLSVAKALKETPAPQDTELRLVARADACDNATAEVVDVSVAETATEIVLEAGLRVDEDITLVCEIRTASDELVVELDRPLGARRVIDNSKSGRTEIWGPDRRRRIQTRLAFTRSEAERFLRSRFPAAEDVACPDHGPLFRCFLRAPPRRKPVEFWVEVHADGTMKASPTELAAIRARERLKGPGGSSRAGPDG